MAIYSQTPVNKNRTQHLHHPLRFLELHSMYLLNITTETEYKSKGKLCDIFYWMEVVFL